MQEAVGYRTGFLAKDCTVKSIGTTGLGEIFSIIEPELAQVEEKLSESIPKELVSIAQALEYVIQAGGKRLRPGLVLLSAKACDCLGDEAIAWATASELIHTASLVHDDLLDGAASRRGLPTVNARWGEAISLLTGEYLWLNVASALIRRRDTEVPVVLADTAMRMFRGEAQEFLHRGDISVSEEEYLQIIESKSASFLSACCEAGASLDGTSPDVSTTLKEYGLHLGFAFQIIDDMLDFTADEASLGKPVGGDARAGTVTLPVIHFLRQAHKRDRKDFLRALRLGKGKEPDWKVVLDLLRQYGSLRYCSRTAEMHTVQARERLTPLKESDAKRSLSALCDFVVERAY